MTDLTLAKESQDCLNYHSPDWSSVANYYLSPVLKMPVLCQRLWKATLFQHLYACDPLRELICHHFWSNNPEKETPYEESQSFWRLNQFVLLTTIIRTGVPSPLTLLWNNAHTNPVSVTLFSQFCEETLGQLCLFATCRCAVGGRVQRLRAPRPGRPVWTLCSALTAILARLPPFKTWTWTSINTSLLSFVPTCTAFVCSAPYRVSFVTEVSVHSIKLPNFAWQLNIF